MKVVVYTALIYASICLSVPPTLVLLASVVAMTMTLRHEPTPVKATR